MCILCSLLTRAATHEENARATRPGGYVKPVRLQSSISLRQHERPPAEPALSRMLPARPRLSLLLENFGLLFVFTRSLRTRERNGISARIDSQSVRTEVQTRLKHRRKTATCPRLTCRRCSPPP